MATIRAIEGRSVHQIQSGQVIVDLSSVVKELLENSLDAGATSIEIRFRNHGLELIEVQDNGKGIPPEDFESVALKHHTSKLGSFEDLSQLDTFGFRGEALSSLCALSRLHITTARSEDGPKGKRLEFEVSGRLKSTSVVAAQTGTIVSVEDLFYNLPVRRKELHKNIKREYAKVINLLHAYACISTGVRYSVSHQMQKANKVAVFSTKSNTSTKDNILNIYGAKTLGALIRLDLDLAMTPSIGLFQGAGNESKGTAQHSLQVHVDGHISKPIFGEGRNAPDRQMYFVNSRPCLLPQVSRAVNEVYKSFNVTQSPFVFANFIMDTNSYDVNVSPDKRTIMLHDQTALLESLKSALTDLFERTDQTVPQATLPSRKLSAYQPLTLPRRGSIEDPPQPSLQSEPDSEDELSGASTSDSKLDSSRGANVTDGTLISRWAEGQSEYRETAQRAEQPDAPHLKRKHVDDENLLPVKPQADVAKRVSEFLERHRIEPPVGSVQDHQSLSSGTEPNIEPVDGQDMELPERPSSNPQTQLVSPQQTITVAHHSSQASNPGQVQNAFDRMRPKRTPMQTAHITIGDKTITTVIGNNSGQKRRRIHEPMGRQSNARLDFDPSVSKSLRSFAAPDSQMEVDSGAVSPDPHSMPSGYDTEETEKSHSTEDEGLIDAVHHAPTEKERSDQVESDDEDSVTPSEHIDHLSDEDYVDEDAKRIAENETVIRLIQQAEKTATTSVVKDVKRAQSLKHRPGHKDATLGWTCSLATSITEIQEDLDALERLLKDSVLDEEPRSAKDNAIVADGLNDPEAESRLSLTVNKTDFERMHIIGQFNLGFILAVRPANEEHPTDELFIIDQHAADEKYNYERLQRTVTLQSQRLVQPKPLDLTAVEEELILSYPEAIKANGFEIEKSASSSDTSDEPSPRHFRLLTLPISREKTFDVSDLEELLHLLSEHPPGSSEIPRPKKVQRMLAMRACRSSIMIGKTLSMSQMRKVVHHMGEMEKPWNCPHGRPTMRHLATLGERWNGWKEGMAMNDGAEETDCVGKTDWKAWLDETNGEPL